MDDLDTIASREGIHRRGSVPAEQVYDPLTGLPGRKAAFAMLARAITLARNCGRGVLAALVDMDRFYVINETRGTAFGDEALRQMASRLCELNRWSASAYRFSGNTFLLFRMVKQGDASEEADMLLEELRQSVAELLPVRGEMLFPYCSIGVSSFPADGETAEMIVRHADTALQQAKAAGGNQVAVYTEEDAAQLRHTEELRMHLHGALARNELVLYYQPVYEADGRLRGFEGLLRWQHPQRGVILPAEFIPLAEQSGVIVEIGEWAIREVCGMWSRARDKGHSDVIVSINLSPLQLAAEDFAESLQRILDETSMPAACLEIELTERILIESGKRICMILRQLKEMGVRFALDDFGAGYASLTFMRKLPLHTLKLDPSFIHHIGELQAETAIVRAMIALVHELGFKVAAEGVETEEQQALLKQWGCDYYQGYLMGMPMGEDELYEHLKMKVSL
ncbi:putative bifunctional diguanylate cyclase/phosphodiesterase [Paenibacillus silvisoli]|uniref:putative bifunctional diguanylate cyclase/phosphodiesterase n=1 Tax=Paenibacillus silvisoli TaxID=3110539 RepID=UPI0028039E5E|nr:bifunctional diguanylate cyclase/phosphodiesterase [Paenibacillus silvisoli]